MMALKKYLTILGMTLAISGCFSTPEVVTETVYVEKTVPIKPRPEPVELYGIEWKVVTEETLDDVITSIKKESGVFVFYALSVTDYERLSLNVAEVHRYLKGQKQLIIYYEKNNSKK